MVKSAHPPAHPPAHLQPGDVVHLKSGGPAMTVTTPVEQGWCACVWFVNGLYQSATFPEAALARAPQLAAE